MKYTCTLETDAGAKEIFEYATKEESAAGFETLCLQTKELEQNDGIKRTVRSRIEEVCDNIPDDMSIF
jgi:hypothetical protein